MCVARESRGQRRAGGEGVGDGGGRTPPTVIASPPVCLKIDVIFVILSTLLPCRPRVSRASAPGHLFLHAYKLTSTLLHTATPSSGFSRRVPRIRDARGSGWKRWILFFLCDFHRRASSPSSAFFIFFFFSEEKFARKSLLSCLLLNEEWWVDEDGKREFEYYSACKFIERTSEDLHQALIFYNCVIIHFWNIRYKNKIIRLFAIIGNWELKWIGQFQSLMEILRDLIWNV